MASGASVDEKNLESSILFMQQDHTATLKALHDEVHKLQSKCTDLTFQLMMSGASVEEGGDADSRLKDLHSKLKTSQSQETTLQSQVTQQNERIQQLTQELRAQKKRQLDETRNVDQTVSSLKAELEAKTNNVAYLTSQLHRLRLKPRAEPHEAGKEDYGVKVRQHAPPQYSHLPTPPRDLLTNSARMRQRGSQAGSRQGVRHIGAVSSARVRSESETPDISPFMHRDLEVGVATVEVKKPAPLPPISASRSGVKERELHRVVISKGGQLTRASVPEVATLAVDQINSVGWKRPSESHSCEHR